MFDLIPNPVGMFEAAINGKMEREFAELLLGTGFSMLFTFLVSLRKLPLLGPAIANMAMAGKINLSNYQDGLALKKFSITYPKDLDNFDWASNFVTVSKES